MDERRRRRRARRAREGRARARRDPRVPGRWAPSTRPRPPFTRGLYEGPPRISPTRRLGTTCPLRQEARWAYEVGPVRGRVPTPCAPESSAEAEELSANRKVDLYSLPQEDESGPHRLRARELLQYEVGLRDEASEGAPDKASICRPP